MGLQPDNGDVTQSADALTAQRQKLAKRIS
jgi:hypothetical protein